MRYREQRQKEERQLLYQVFQESANTKEEKLLGFRDAQFIENCLEIMKLKSLMGIGSKRGGLACQDTIQQMIEVEINQRYELGLMPIKAIQLDDIKSAMFNFTFQIIKIKAKKIKEGKKPIRYKNNVSVFSDTVESARFMLQARLKKLGDIMVEELSFTRTIDSITTVSGEFYPYREIEIIH